MPKFYDGKGITPLHALEDAMRKRRCNGNHKPAKVIDQLIAWRDEKDFNYGFDYYVVVRDV